MTILSISEACSDEKCLKIVKRTWVSFGKSFSSSVIGTRFKNFVSNCDMLWKTLLKL